jgi:hypothetical protein
MIRITSLRDGFRRAGIAHPAQPTEHPDDTFTADQLAALQAEPMLTVEVVAPEGAPAKPRGKSAKAD